jgi:hypothetical protein
MKQTIKPGTQVRIGIRAGLCRPDNDSYFVGAADAGTIGVYKGRHAKMPEWHLVAVGELIAPLHSAHFSLSPAPPKEEPR